MVGVSDRSNGRDVLVTGRQAWALDTRAFSSAREELAGGVRQDSPGGLREAPVSHPGRRQVGR